MANDTTKLLFTIKIVVRRSIKPRKLSYSYSTDTLCGRDTRVFEGNVLRDRMPYGPSVAIKDAWVDRDRNREASILADFFSKANGIDKLLIQQYFLAVLVRRDVVIAGDECLSEAFIRRLEGVLLVTRYMQAEAGADVDETVSTG
jgi:hypothetical protein